VIKFTQMSVTKITINSLRMAGFPEVVRWIEKPKLQPRSCGHESVTIWKPDKSQLRGNTHPILYSLYQQHRITSDHTMLNLKKMENKNHVPSTQTNTNHVGNDFCPPFQIPELLCLDCDIYILLGCFLYVFWFTSDLFLS
jgi:hypothetical protein